MRDAHRIKQVWFVLDKKVCWGYTVPSDRTTETWEARSPEGSCGGLSLFSGKYKGGREMKKKGFLTYDEQIVFLREEKNLEIQDEEYAKKILGSYI